MVWTRSPVYFYQRKDIYYFSRAVPQDLQARFNKRRVEASLKTKSGVGHAYGEGNTIDKKWQWMERTK